MKAIRQYEFGDADVLRFDDAPDPRPGPDQVLIGVAAAGVHLLDTALRAGSPGPFGVPELPMTPGREVAGVVVDGPREWVGRRVVAHLGMASGGYAELAAAPVESVHEIPAGLGADAAVAMIGTGRTALGVLDLAEITADDVVLVPAAAGGLGTLFVQAARNAGATVIGLAGGRAKVDRVRELGADIAVDYTSPDWPAAVGPRPTVVLDGVGGAVGRAALELLDMGGRLVMFGWSAGEVTSFTSADVAARGLTVSWVTGPRMLRRHGGLRPLETAALTAAAAGRLVPVVHPPFALADAAAAHRALESRATTGKVVLRP